MRCPRSPPHRRVSVTNKGSPKDSPGLRGHAWEKVYKDDIHIGRRCKLCGKIILTPRSKIA